MIKSLLGFAALAFLAGPLAASNVLCVKPNGGPGTYPDLQAAIDAAANGDIILVSPGIYAPVAPATGFAVTNKALTLVGPVAASSATLQATLTISGIGPGQFVCIRGVDINTFATKSGHALVLENNAGLVFLSDCQLNGSHSTSGPVVEGAGCFAANNAAVIAAQSKLLAGNGLTPGDSGGHGLDAASSMLCLYASSSTTLPNTVGACSGGVAAAGGGGLAGGDGGDGAHIGGGFLFAAGTLFHGSHGGNGQSSPCTDGGDGGDGLDIASASATVMSDCTFVAGQGGGAGSLCSSGSDGQLVAGVVQTMPTPAHHTMTTNQSSVKAGQAIQCVFRGDPGELVYFTFSANPGFVFLPQLSGVLCLGSIGPVVSTSGSMTPLIIPATGSLSFTSPPTGSLPPGVDGAVLFLQAAFFNPTTLGIYVGSPTALAVISPTASC